MKLIECTAAYAALCELSKTEWPVKTAYSIFRLKKALKEHAEFYSQRELELVYSVAEKDERGQIAWIDEPGKSFAIKPGERERYVTGMRELADIVVETAFPPLIIEGDGSIKPEHLEKLEAFLEEDKE